MSFAMFFAPGDNAPEAPNSATVIGPRRHSGSLTVRVGVWVNAGSHDERCRMSYVTLGVPPGSARTGNPERSDWAPAGEVRHRYRSVRSGAVAQQRRHSGIVQRLVWGYLSLISLA